MRRLLPLLLIVAAACAGPADDPSAEAPPSPAEEASEVGPRIIDLRDVDLADELGRPRVAVAAGEDTSRVTIRELEPRDTRRILWIHWRRPEGGAFRVTREGAEASYLTEGPVAAISQTTVPAGETSIELLVVSESAWEATVLDGTFSDLPGIGIYDRIAGSGPTFLTVTDPEQPPVVVLDADDPDQVPRLLAFDAAGTELAQVVGLPEDLGSGRPLPEGSTLLLVDVRDGWELRVDG